MLHSSISESEVITEKRFLLPSFKLKENKYANYDNDDDDDDDDKK